MFSDTVIYLNIKPGKYAAAIDDDDSDDEED
jgi:hypothetical protein